MGLCKCPKRRVTNQFCFEHRVNVCEHCLVTNHPKCIVQSYLQWLQDSDYNPICELCTKVLANEECVRLVCYHVYHWACIDQFGRQLPATTAPAGYTCPSCKVGLFPSEVLVSPVADVLREKLAAVNWARAGLGLPLLMEDHTVPHENRKVLVTSDHVQSNHTHDPRNDTSPSPNPHSVVHVEENAPFSRNDNLNLVPKRVFQDLDDAKDVSYDHDENKYKRRSAFEVFFRWWKSLWRPVPRGRLYYRRYLLRVALIVIVVCTILILFSWLGQIVTRDDPSLDFHNNPNIRIGNIQET